MNVLVTYPAFGSVWLTDARYVSVGGRPFVVGEAEDRGEPVTLNFPTGCIRKVEEDGWQRPCRAQLALPLGSKA